MSAEKSLFDTLAELIGKEEALIMCEMIGGQTLYIPKKISLHDDIRKVWVEYLGDEAFDRVCEHFGGQRIYVPAAPAELIELRNATIVGRARSGDQIATIAADFHITERAVRNIFNRIVNADVIDAATNEENKNVD